MTSFQGKARIPQDSSTSTKSSPSDRVLSVIHESCVLHRYGDAPVSARDWDWGLVGGVFTCLGESLSAGMDAGGGGSSSAGGSPQYQFARRVLDFYRPSSSKFAKIDLKNAAVKTHAVNGCCMLDFLVKSKSVSKTTCENCRYA